MRRFEHHRAFDDVTAKAVRDLVDAVSAAQGFAPLGEAKLAELSRDDVDWSAILAYTDDTLVGYAHVHWNDHAPRAVVEVAVQPTGADDPAAVRIDLGSALLEEAKTAVAHAGGGVLWSWAHHVDDVADTPQARAGFRVQRRLAVMERSLQPPPPVPDLPERTVVRSYRSGHDEGEFLRVNNAAFAGHPEQGGWELADLRAHLERDWFDPADLLMAWRGDELLGFHWTKRHGSEAAVGEVYVLGIHPDAQGLGLGRSLLRAGLRHLRDLGCEKVILYVDTAGDAAVRLYESEGFSRLYDEVCYETSVSSLEAPDGSSL